MRPRLGAWGPVGRPGRRSLPEALKKGPFLGGPARCPPLAASVAGRLHERIGPEAPPPRAGRPRSADPFPGRGGGRSVPGGLIGRVVVSSPERGGGNAPKNPKEEAAPATPAAVPAAVPEKAARKDRPERSPKNRDPKEETEGKPGKPGKAGKAGAPGAAPKGRKKPIPDNPNFRYIVRIAGSDLDGTRSAGMALTGVAGVGARISDVACRLAGVNPSEMIGNLPEATVEGIEKVLESLATRVPPWMVNHPSDYATGEVRHYIGPSLDTARRDDVNILRMVRSYKGVRHERGQKVRGQRTRSNGRTGMAAGVLKKAAKEAAAVKATEAEAEKKK